MSALNEFSHMTTSAIQLEFKCPHLTCFLQCDEFISSVTIKSNCKDVITTLVDQWDIYKSLDILTKQ